MYSVNLRCVNNPPPIRKVIEFDGVNFDESIKEIEFLSIIIFLTFFSFLSSRKHYLRKNSLDLILVSKQNELIILKIKEYWYESSWNYEAWRS